MARKQTPSVVKAVQSAAKLEIDGRTYELVWDYNAIAEAEAETGGVVNLLHGISAFMLMTMSALQFRGLFYAALQPRQPYRPATKDRPASGISLQAAGALIRINTMERISRAMNEAWGLALPEAPENPPKAAGEEPPVGE